MILSNFAAALTDYSTSYDSTTTVDTTTDTGAALSLIAIIFTLVMLWSIPSLITQWKLFKKAGQPGWSSIIPIYSTYVLGVISKKPMWMVWIAVVGSFLGIIPILGMLLSLASLVFIIILLVGFIQQYKSKYGAGFWFAYFLLPIVSVFLVKDVEYIGDGGQPTTNNLTPVSSAAPQMPQSPSIQPMQPVQPQVVQTQTPQTMQQPQQSQSNDQNPQNPQMPQAPTYQ